MRKNLYQMVLVGLLLVGLVSCGEKPEEDVKPELPEEENITVEEATISSFSPLFMIEGETAEIQIEGVHFSENAEEVEVLLLNAEGEEVKLEIQSVSSSLITATAANVSATGIYSLRVKNKDQEVNAAAEFTVHGKLAVDPIVGSSLEDGSYTIEVGGYLLITGKNFSEKEENNQIWLIDAKGQETAAIMLVSKFDRLGFLVPQELPIGDYKMRIVTDIQEFSAERQPYCRRSQSSY
jgi:hypothetical protein